VHVVRAVVDEHGVEVGDEDLGRRRLARVVEAGKELADRTLHERRDGLDVRGEREALGCEVVACHRPMMHWPHGGYVQQCANPLDTGVRARYPRVAPQSDTRRLREAAPGTSRVERWRRPVCRLDRRKVTRRSFLI
jgi:hypothetical protein